MPVSVKPSHCRLEKWELKFNPERIKAITEEFKPRMLAHAAAKFDDICEMELSVKQTLSHYPISVALIPMYLCYGREMWKANRRYDGEIFRREAREKIAKWVARQLDEEVLTRVCTQVFNVDPNGPAAAGRPSGSA
jgi:hypothetical protein